MKKSIRSSKDPHKAIFKHVSANLNSEEKQALTRLFEKIDAATLKRVFYDLEDGWLYKLSGILSNAATGQAYRTWDDTSALIQELEQDPEGNLELWAQRLTDQERAASDMPPNYAYTHLVLLPLLRPCFDALPSDVEFALENPALEGEHPTALLGLATKIIIETTPTIEAQNALYGWSEEDEYWDEDEDEDDEDDDEWEAHREEEEEDEEDVEQHRALAIEGFNRCINNVLRAPQPLAAQQLRLASNLRPEDIQPALTTLYQLKGAHISDVSFDVDRVNIIELITWSTTTLQLERLEIDLSREVLADDDGSIEMYELDLGLLTRQPKPRHLKELTIRCARHKPGSLRALLESPIAAQLEILTLINNELDDEDAHTLASSTPSTLRELCLDQNIITQEGLAAIAAAPQLQALQAFTMYGELIVIEDIDQLRQSQSDRFGELRSLLQQPPDDESWELLCNIIDCWPDMEQLEREIIPYVLSHIEAWPSELCVMPERWLLRLKRGLKLPMIGLVKEVYCDWLDKDCDVFAQGLGEHPTLELKSLAIEADMQLTATMLEVFTQRTAFKNIESLRLFSREWDEPETTQRALLKARYPKLTKLSLWGYGLPEIFEEVLSAPYIGQLTSLLFIDTELELKELKKLIASEVFAQLEHFALAQSELSPAELKALLKVDAPKLRRLNLSDNLLTAKALETLLTSALGAQLVELDLGDNSLKRGDPFEKLKDADLRIESLNLRNTDITTKALTSLAQCKWLGNVKSLDLSENQLYRSKGLIALLQSEHLSNIEKLLLDIESIDGKLDQLIKNSPTLSQAVRDDYSYYAG